MNHMLFVDENTLFYKADMPENRRILELLETYEQASKQQINKDKTTMTFSKNVKPATQRMLMTF